MKSFKQKCLENTQARSLSAKGERGFTAYRPNKSFGIDVVWECAKLLVFRVMNDIGIKLM
jgi:hypothetical protein